MASNDVSAKRQQQIDNLPEIPGTPPDRPGDKWVGRWRIGEGADGVVFVWIKTDAEDRIIQRLVEKRKILRPGQSVTDYMENFRTGENTNPFVIKEYWWLHGGAANCTKPREGEIHRLLSNEKNIVECYGYNVESSKRLWRIYMEYAGKRNLEFFVAREGQKATKVKPIVPIPEPFCWYVLGELAKAALAMQNPSQIKLQYPEMDDAQIIHHDIKPANIFLGPRREDYFPVYPSLKLGDFGLAQETWRTDTSDPLLITSEKQFMPLEFRTGDKELRTQASNVCQIGLIVQYMMLKAEANGIGGNLRAIPRGTGGVHVPDGAFRVEPIRPHVTAYQDDDDDDDDDEDPMDYAPGLHPGMNVEQPQQDIRPPTNPAAPEQSQELQPIRTGLRYSEDLINLIHRCTHIDPNLRPLPKEIIDACEPTTNPHIKDMHDPVEAVKPNKAEYWLFNPDVVDRIALGNIWRNAGENTQYDTPSEDEESSQNDDTEDEMDETT